MAHRIFVDTNIVLDLLVEERDNHTAAKTFIAYLLENNKEIVISEDMLSTIYYIAKNKDRTLLFLQTIQAQWRIISYGQKVIEKSLQYALNNSCDLEDSLQCFAAIENGCEVLATSDKTFVICGDIKLVHYDNYKSILNAS